MGPAALACDFVSFCFLNQRRFGMKVLMLLLGVTLLAPSAWAKRVADESPQCRDLVRYFSDMATYGRSIDVVGHFAQLEMSECGVQCGEPKRWRDRGGPLHITRACSAKGVADFKYTRSEFVTKGRAKQYFTARVNGEKIKVICNFYSSDALSCFSKVW